MQALTSPGSLVTIAGAALTVIGSIAYATDSPNLSLAGVFYGVPVLLGGLALKSSELPPAQRLTPSQPVQGTAPAGGQRAPAQAAGRRDPLALRPESTPGKFPRSPQALGRRCPPQLLSIAEVEQNGGYGLRLRFSTGAVPYDQWEARQDRLGRFFGPGLQAELSRLGGDQLQLSLLPAAGTTETTTGDV